MNRNKRAFTLIELLVVVVIIAILASVALPMYQKAVRKSRAAGAWTAMKTMSDSMNDYYMRNGDYPDSLLDLDIQATKIFGFEARL